MKTTQPLFLQSIFFAAAAVLAVACNSNDQPASPFAGPRPGSVPSGAATVTATPGDSGDHLSDANGMSLYMFKADTANQSNCNSDCAEAWPPLTLSAGQTPVAGTGIDQSLLGQIQRSDGKIQVTYKSQPLYMFAGDTAAGQTNGQGVNAFGAEWYLVKADGSPIEDTSSIR